MYVLKDLSIIDGNLVKAKASNGFELYLERKVLRPFLSHITVETYAKPLSKHWLIFPYYLENGKALLIPANEMSSSYPRVWEYLQSASKILRGRESGKADNDQWYGYIYRKNLTLFDDPKIIVQVISRKGKYAYDDASLYFSGGGNGPYYGIRLSDQNNQHSLHYLQALLSSTLLDYYLHHVSTAFRGGYWSYGKRFIEKLPIRTIDFSNPEDVARHDRMISLVQSLINLHKQLASTAGEQERTLLQRRIEATDQQIDRLVYELYDLTEEEIAIVERK
jgi:hypothetical protein